jgi:hypothetical protein
MCFAQRRDNIKAGHASIRSQWHTNEVACLLTQPHLLRHQGYSCCNRPAADSWQADVTPAAASLGTPRVYVGHQQVQR